MSRFADWDAMKLESLREFQSLAHCLNFSQAAKETHITQPNLSKHIAEIEKEIGFPLFQKEGKTALTPAGKKYLDAVCRILLIHDNAIDSCNAINSTPQKEIRILAPMIYNEGFRMLSKALALYKAQRPYCTFTFKTNQNVSTLNAVIQKRADLSVITASTTVDALMDRASRHKVVLEHIAAAPLCAWIDSGHSLAKKESLTWDDLKESHLAFPANILFDDVRNAGTDIFLKAGVFPKCPFTVYAVQNAEEFYLGVNNEDICIMTPMMVNDSAILSHDERVLVPIDEETAFFDFYVAYKEENAQNLDPVLSILREL